jgi:hypothetical protein
MCCLANDAQNLPAILSRLDSYVALLVWPADEDIALEAGSAEQSVADLHAAAAGVLTCVSTGGYTQQLHAAGAPAALVLRLKQYMAGGGSDGSQHQRDALEAVAGALRDMAWQVYTPGFDDTAAAFVAAGCAGLFVQILYSASTAAAAAAPAAAAVNGGASSSRAPAGSSGANLLEHFVKLQEHALGGLWNLAAYPRFRGQVIADIATAAGHLQQTAAAGTSAAAAAAAAAGNAQQAAGAWAAGSQFIQLLLGCLQSSYTTVQYKAIGLISELAEAEKPLFAAGTVAAIAAVLQRLKDAKAGCIGKHITMGRLIADVRHDIRELAAEALKRLGAAGYWS